MILPGILALLLLGNPLLSMVVAAFAFLIEIPCLYLVLVIWPRQRELKRRLDRVVASFRGDTLPDVTTDDSVSVFREQRSKSRLVERLEYQFPMIDVRKVLPRAVGLGVLGMVATGLGAAFMGFGLLAVLFLLPVGGLGCSWAVLAMQDAGQRNEFTKILSRDHRSGGAPGAGRRSVNGGHFDCVPGGPAAGRWDHARNSLAVAAGLDPETAIRSTAERVRIPAFSLFSAAVCLQLTTGGGISGALGNLSATLRARHLVTLKAKSSTAQTRLTLAIISFVPVVVLAIQNFTNPQTIETLFHTESGGTLLRFGVGPYSEWTAGRPRSVRPSRTVSHALFCIIPLLGRIANTVWCCKSKRGWRVPELAEPTPALRATSPERREENLSYMIVQ